MRFGEVGRSLVAFLLSFAMVLSMFFVVIGVQRTAFALDPPTRIHLTWNENENSTAYTIVVTWETSTATSGDNVKYGINSDNYIYSAVGSHHTYSGASENIHDVELTGLSPNTTYYFICGGDTGGWSGERSFRTAPDQSTAIRFVAGGDSRSGSGDWPSGRDNVSRAMANFNPSFVLYVGDFVMQGNYQSEWDSWFTAEQTYWVDNNNLTIPIIPCVGNHDVSGDGGTAYLGQFSLPGNEQWYSFDWGPNLHITVLDTETTISGNQTNWLRQDLAAHENYLWKVVLFHEPPFSDGPDGYNSSVRTYWVPLFDNYHVDLVVSGHNHLYERTYPINYTISQNTPMPSTENATVYVVSGGWGAPLYTGSPSWFAAVGPISTYHFVVIDISDGTLQLRAVDTHGNVIDTYTIAKSTVSISPSSQVGENGTTLNYTVTVTNTENVSDNFNLTVSDNDNWAPTPTVSPTLLTVLAGDKRTAMLSVTIPENATGGAIDNITVTATSQIDNTIGSDSCTAQVVLRGVNVVISPGSQIADNGATLNYTVTVTNTGNISDNYKLAVINNQSWNPTLSDNKLNNITPSGNKTTTLTITVPGSVTQYTEDNITVTATSQADNTVNANNNCIARAPTWVGTATFTLENLYKVSLEKDLQLYTGSKLVVKFFNYSNAFESEVVIENNIALPLIIVDNENVPHPPTGSSPVAKAVKKAELDLTTENEEVISTIASFTVHQSDLRNRYIAILRVWSGSPGQQSAFRAEIIDTLKEWSGAPI
jgi:hypothetical protein